MVLKFMNYYNLLNKYKKILLSLLFIAIAIVIVNSALLKDVVYQSDDYLLHATRIGNYYLALKEGQFPVRWGSNLNQAYGYPSFNYMYHTPYLTSSALHMIGLSVQQSLNISVLLAVVFGSLSCYFFIKEYLKSEKWSVLLALFYSLNPYSLLNIYWRGAIGEIFFYSLIPLFLLAVKKKNVFLIAITTSLLLLSHLPSMLLLAILMVFYYIAELKSYRICELFKIFVSGLIGLLLSAWYVLPAYFEQWMIEYQLGSSLNQYSSQFVSTLSLLDIRKDSFSSSSFINVLTIGGVALIGIFIGLFLLKYSKKTIIWVVSIILSIFLISSQSSFIWSAIKPLQYVQYPWRFIWIIIISVLFIFIYFNNQKKVSKKINNFVFILATLGIIFSVQAFTNTKGSTSRTDFDWYHPVQSTGSSFNEHNPIGAHVPYNFPEPLMYVNASQSANIIREKIETLVHPLNELSPKINLINGTKIIYSVNPDQDIIVLHKRLFYPGWEAHLDGKPVEFIKDIPQYDGVLAIKIPNKQSNIEIEFTGYTLLRRISEIISLSAMILVIGFYLLKKLSQNS